MPSKSSKKQSMPIQEVAPHGVVAPRRSVIKKVIVAGLASGATVSAPGFVHAQSAYPNKPIRLIVAFPPGGVADVMARSLAPALSESLGQPVVIENRGGANGNVAAEVLAKSPNDGHTLLMCSTGIESVNPYIFPKMPFDPKKDLVQIAATGKILLFLISKPSLPFSDAKGMVAYAKANPAKLSYGSAGSGSTPHLAGELFKQSAGFFAVHVPYRGAAPALQDLLAGNLDYYFDPGIGLPHVRSGRLKILATASGKRSQLLPDLPTLNELGFKGADIDTWFGIYAPGGTSPEIVARLNRDINKAISAEAYRNRVRDLGGEVSPMSPEQFKAIGVAEMDVFSKLIKARNIQAD